MVGRKLCVIRATEKAGSTRVLCAREAEEEKEDAAYKGSA